MTTTEPEISIALRERRAQTLLAVRAFEESDPDCLLLSAAEREKSTRRALAVTGLADGESSTNPIDARRRAETLTRRARLLFDLLEKRVPGLRRMIAVSSVAGMTLPAVAIAGALAGALGNALGPWRRVNLLAFPLFALWAWNVAVFVLIAVRVATRARLVAGVRRRSSHASRFGGKFVGTIVRFALRRQLHRSHSADGGGRTDRERLEVRAVMRYGALWRRTASELLARRVSVALHLGSSYLVGGMLGGMYLRALAFEYRVGWESTLLEPHHVQALFDVIFRPAAFLLGIDVPDVGPLRVVGGAAGGGGDAALWIHLFALTSVGVVLVPRLALAAYSAIRATRLSHRLPIAVDAPYYRRAFVTVRGASRTVVVQPYSFQPRQTTTHALSCLLAEHFGARAVIDQREPLAYGAPLPAAESAARRTDRRRTVCRVLLFNLAQTPEIEVHGALLRQARERAEDDGDELLVGIDVTAYVSRLPDRHRERLRSWRALIEECGLEPFTIEASRPIDERALLEVASALYRPSVTEHGV